MASRKVKAVHVGCGGISSKWFNAAAGIAGLEIAGLVDLDTAAAERKKEEFGLSSARTGTDLRAMLQAVDPDVVFDCTVPEAHCAVTLEALRHGCHVLGEKPLADTPANARRMVRAVEKAGKVYAVTQNRRFDPNIRAFAKWIDSGRIGGLTALHCDFHMGARFAGFRLEMAHVLLIDMAIHTFDAARFITGLDAEYVYCRDWNPSNSWFKDGASAVAVFEMEKGVVFTYRGSWCADGFRTSWNSEWRAVGGHGTALWDGADSLRSEALKKPGDPAAGTRSASPRATAMKHTGHDGLMRDFLSCLRTGRTPETVCSDNIKSLAMVFAAVKSAETGRRVKVEA